MNGNQIHLLVRESAYHWVGLASVLVNFCWGHLPWPLVFLHCSCEWQFYLPSLSIFVWLSLCQQAYLGLSSRRRQGVKGKVETNLPKSVHLINWGYLGCRGSPSLSCSVIPLSHFRSYIFWNITGSIWCLVGVFGISGVKNCVFVL